MTAIEYNEKQDYSAEVIEHIQRTVGSNPDGRWGPATVRQVRAWQRSAGLTADGKVGSATLKVLEALWAKDSELQGDEDLDDLATDEVASGSDEAVVDEPEPALSSSGHIVVASYEDGYDYFDRDRDLGAGDSGNDVVALQNDLFAFGFEPGTPDGKLGKTGVAALTSFQDACMTPDRIGGFERVKVPVTLQSHARGVVDAATRAEIRRWKEHGWRYVAQDRDYVERRVRVKHFGALPRSSALLREVPSSSGHTRKLHRLAAEALDAMSKAAVADGLVELEAASAWRPHRWKSWEHYETVMKEKYGSVKKGRIYMAYNSPHETGLAIDFGVGGLSPNRKTIKAQRETELHEWLVANAYRFGWHPYTKEPWHWEFPLSLRAWTLGLSDWRLKA